MHELVPVGGKGRLVGDPARQCGGDGHHAPGLHPEAVALHDYRRSRLIDPSNRGLQLQAIAQPLAEVRGQDLRSPHQPVLLSATAEPQEDLEAGPGAEVEQRVEEGEGGGVGGKMTDM